MAWGPFKSRADLEAERKVKMAKGRRAIQDYLKHTRAASQRYLGMGKKALSLGERRQGEQYVATHLQYENQARRWDSFLLKIDDIELRGSALGAMGDLVGGLNSLVKSIEKGLSPAELEKTMASLENGMFKADQVEGQLAAHMENMTINVGPESLGTPSGEIPEELRGEVDRICGSLMQEAAAETPGVLPGRRETGAEPARGGDPLQDRLAGQMARLKQIRQEDSRK